MGEKIRDVGVGLDLRLISNGGSTAQKYEKIFAVRTLQKGCKFVAQKKRLILSGWIVY